MKKEFDVEIPMRPNFIKVNGTMIHISEFNVVELRQIGKEWGDLLAEESRRKKPTT